MTMKRVLPLMLALLLFVSPLAHAEGTYGQITLSNFQVGYGAVESVPVDAVLKLGAGVSEGEGLFRADAELLGGGKSAFAASVDAADDALRVKFGGSNLYFTLPYASIDDTVKAQDWYEGNIKDRASFIAYIAGFTKAEALEGYTKPLSVVRKFLKAEPKGEEQVELFGEMIALQRFDASLDSETVGDFIDALAESNPAIKYLIAEVQRMEKSKPDIHADISLWVDAAALDDDGVRLVKGTAKILIEQEKAYRVAAFSNEVLMNVASKDMGQGQFILLDITNTVDPGTGIHVEGSYGVSSGGGTEDNVAADLKVNGMKGIMSARMTYSRTTDGEGVTDANLAVHSGISYMPIDLDYSFDGQTATPSQQKGVVKLDMDSLSLKGNLQCDALLEAVPLVPLTDADFEGLEAADPFNADAKTSQRVNLAMQAVGTRAMGVIMATPGVARLISAAQDPG